jgi:uncharacterized membrane protein
VALPEVTVSNVVVEQNSVSFSVDQVGVPVLVRVSYFPNWSVDGAEGVYRVAPNSMVVVPTSHDVVLTYGRTWLDWLTILASLAGIALCIWWRRRGDAEFASEMPGMRPLIGENDTALTVDGTDVPADLSQPLPVDR